MVTYPRDDSIKCSVYFFCRKQYRQARAAANNTGILPSTDVSATQALYIALAVRRVYIPVMVPGHIYFGLPAWIWHRQRERTEFCALSTSVTKISSADG